MESHGTRCIKLHGLPEVLHTRNGSARTIDATVKPAPRRSQYLARQSPAPINSHSLPARNIVPPRHVPASPIYNHHTATTAAQTTLDNSRLMPPHSPIPATTSRSNVRTPTTVQPVRRIPSAPPTNPAPSPVCSEQCLSDSVRRVEEVMHVFTEKLDLILGRLEKTSSTLERSIISQSNNQHLYAQSTSAPPDELQGCRPRKCHHILQTSRCSAPGPDLMTNPVFEPIRPTQPTNNHIPSNIRANPSPFFQNRITTPPCYEPTRVQQKYMMPQYRGHFQKENIAVEPSNDLEISFASQEYINRHKLN